MKTIVITVVLSLFSLAYLSSQDLVDSLLAEIEKNNTRLKALNKMADAERMNNRTGLLPPNPEVGINYLKAEPFEIGYRTDLEIRQSFDFPTVYLHKNRISRLRNSQVELEYEKEKIEILHGARLLLYELIYYNAMEEEYLKRMDQARSIVFSYSRKLEEGDASVLDYNKAKLDLLNVSKRLESIQINKADLINRLEYLNGGTALDFKRTNFNIPEIPPDFEEWYNTMKTNNPELRSLEMDIEAGKRKEKLSFAQALPGFSAGYMSESLVGEKFRGITVGFTIPLWEDKNRMKSAKISTEASKELASDRLFQFEKRMKSLFDKTLNLKFNVQSYKEQLEMLDHRELLLKALDRGEINFIEYYTELYIYYQSHEELLKLQLELSKSYSELIKYL